MIDLQFMNMTNTVWQRGYYSLTKGLLDGHVDRAPGLTLDARSSQQLTISENALRIVATHTIDVKCCWWEPNSRVLFGIWAHAPYKFVLGTGKSPYWLTTFHTTDDKMASEHLWSRMDASPWKIVLDTLPFGVEATPTCERSSLSILVKIDSHTIPEPTGFVTDLDIG